MEGGAKKKLAQTPLPSVRRPAGVVFAAAHRTRNGMPRYEYDCSRCGSFSDFRPLAEYELPVACPSCGAELPRAVLCFPAISTPAAAMRADAAQFSATQSMGRAADAAAARISKFRAKNGRKSCSDREPSRGGDYRPHGRAVSGFSGRGRSGRHVVCKLPKPFCGQLNYDTKKVGGLSEETSARAFCLRSGIKSSTEQIASTSPIRLQCMGPFMMLWTAPPPARECQRWGRR